MTKLAEALQAAHDRGVKIETGQFPNDLPSGTILLQNNPIVIARVTVLDDTGPVYDTELGQQYLDLIKRLVAK